MVVDSKMDFWLTLNGENIDLTKTEELLQVKMESNRIIPPVIDVGTEEYPVFYKEIDWLLNLIEKNEEELIKLGVSFSESEIWMIYWYKNQCNIEFDANILERIGTHGLHFCISCEHIG